MKKYALEAEKLERQPEEYRTKIEEMKGVKNEIHKALKTVKAKEEKLSEVRLNNTLKESVRNILKAGALPFPLIMKKAHSLGDFYGKFHPSKSKKGIKRSE